MAEERDYYVESIPIPETPSPGAAPKPWGKTRVIGKGLPKIDAYERLSGRAIYPSDVSPPRHALRCDPPFPSRQRQRQGNRRERRREGGGGPGYPQRIDSRCRSAVVYGRDQRFKLFDPRCRYEGEVVAAIAADTPYHAWDAVRAIKVDYEVLPFVADEALGLFPGAARVHSEGNRVKASDLYERGDVAKGFAEADVVLEETYRTACELHTPMETHGCVAKWDGHELTLWESTQGVYAVQAQVAEVLGLPLSKVRVIGHYMGGGFEPSCKRISRRLSRPSLRRRLKDRLNSSLPAKRAISPSATGLPQLCD